MTGFFKVKQDIKQDLSKKKLVCDSYTNKFFYLLY